MKLNFLTLLAPLLHFSITTGFANDVGIKLEDAIIQELFLNRIVGGENVTDNDIVDSFLKKAQSNVSEINVNDLQITVILLTKGKFGNINNAVRKGDAKRKAMKIFADVEIKDAYITYKLELLKTSFEVTAKFNAVDLTFTLSLDKTETTGVEITIKSIREPNLDITGKRFLGWFLNKNSTSSTFVRKISPNLETALNHHYKLSI